MKILNQKDLYELLPFKKTKFNELLQSRILPVTKIGRDYITSEEQIMKWLKDNEGRELKY